MGQLEGRVALVTGAARGQGRSHAVRLAREGADVVVVDVAAQLPLIDYPMGSPGGLAETVAEIEELGRRAVSAQADVRDAGLLRTVVDEAVAELGRLDVVVANAAICTAQRWNEVTPEIWEETIGINLTGTWNTAQVTLPHLIAAGGGSLILISSASAGRGSPFLTPYVVAKSGVLGMMRSLANEVASAEVRVNAVLPGGVDTAMAHGTRAQLGPLLEEAPLIASTFAPALPSERLAPETISDAVAFLAGDAARFITGVALPVDAGIMNR